MKKLGIIIAAAVLLFTTCTAYGQVMDGEDMVRSSTQISQEEALYDTKGNPLVMQGFTTNTDTMTPILAALYNEVAGRESREAVLGKKY